MIILVLNCGSSSIKYQVFDFSKGCDMRAKGLLERIGLADGIMTHKPTGKETYKIRCMEL
jgi:acetate kinase